MSKTSTGRPCNGLDPEVVGATAELVRAGLADVTKLDDQLLGAVLVWAIDAADSEVHAAVYTESEIRSMLCHWCVSLLLRSPTTRRRWTVVHEADCLPWTRYAQRVGGYTALPTGELWGPAAPWPQGAERVLTNGPVAPCGAVVTWRGPNATQASQEAAERAAVRKSTGRAGRAA